jgi:hypothetical protein
MQTILSIDAMANRYGCLPSELLDRATTFDMWVCNSSMRYQQIKQAEAEGNFDHYSIEQLEALKNGVNT